MKSRELDRSGSRLLDLMEAMFVPSNHFVGYSVLCRGSFNRAALISAFDTLRSTHPVLAGHIAQRGNRHAIEPRTDGTNGTVTATVIRKVSGEPTRLSDDQMDQWSTLSVLDIAESVDGARVTLLIHHAIADATAGKAMLAELWDQYAHIVNTGAPRPFVPNAFPPSPSDVLAQHGYTVPEVDFSSPSFEDPLPPDLEDGAAQPVQVRFTLSTEQTESLLDLARKNGVTLNGIICAALLRGNARARGWKADARVPVHYPIDLRNRLSPAVLPTEVTVLIGIGVIDVENPREIDSIVFAKKLQDQIQRELASREAFTSTMRILIEGHRQGTVSPSLALTNFGVIPDLSAPDGLVLSDFVAVTPTMAQGDIRHPATYRAQTFKGQLSIELAGGASGTTSPAEVHAAIKEELLSDVTLAAHG